MPMLPVPLPSPSVPSSAAGLLSPTEQRPRVPYGSGTPSCRCRKVKRRSVCRKETKSLKAVAGRMGMADVFEFCCCRCPAGHWYSGRRLSCAGSLVPAAWERCPFGWHAAWRQGQPQLGHFGLLLSSELAEHLPALLSRQRSVPGRLVGAGVVVLANLYETAALFPEKWVIPGLSVLQARWEHV